MTLVYAYRVYRTTFSVRNIALYALAVDECRRVRIHRGRRVNSHIHDDVYTRARASDDGLINNINSITHASPSSRYFIVMLHSGYTVSQNVHFSFF